MGREAECAYQIGSEQAHTKVLLEPAGIIIRGKLRRTIPIGSIKDLRVDGSKLLFRTGEDNVTLELGQLSTHGWLSAMQKPPVTLAHNLGITATTRIRVLGNIDSPELSQAVASGPSLLRQVNQNNPKIWINAERFRGRFRKQLVPS